MAVLLTHSQIAAGLPSMWTRVVSLDEEASQIAAQPTYAPAQAASTDHHAYIIYNLRIHGRASRG